MMKSIEFFIARRYLRSRRRPQFLALNVLISIFGVAVGVAALIIVMAVFNGLNYEIKSRIVGLEGHLRIRLDHNEKGLANYADVISHLLQEPEVVSASPFISELAMVAMPDGKNRAVEVKGLSPDFSGEMKRLQDFLEMGDVVFERTPLENEPPLPGILIGREMAMIYGLTLGEPLHLISSTGLSVMATSFMNPLAKRFRITGIFNTGLIEVDQNMVIIGLNQAQQLFRYGADIGGIEVRLNDIDQAPKFAERMNRVLQAPVLAETWFEKNKMLFSWMRVEKWGAFLVLTLIIIVAAFNIISSLIMNVMDKTPEIGIFKSIGATEKRVTRVFLLQGGIIGISGTVIGVIFGYLGCWAQETFKLFSIPSGVYFMDALPVRLMYGDVVLISVSAIIVSILAAWYPAQKAGKLDPVAAIRNQI